MSKKPTGPNARRTPSFEQNAQELAAQRESLMAEMAMRASLGIMTPMISKSRALLTRFWGAADWSERAELLRTARWLLQLGVMQPALVLRTTEPPKRRKPPGSAR